jgi:hypothetical protein
MTPICDLRWRSVAELVLRKRDMRKTPMSDPTTTNRPGPWSRPEAAPEDGTEFEYVRAGSWRIHRGSLGNDMGGSIVRDPDMLAWRLPAPAIKWAPR